MRSDKIVGMALVMLAGGVIGYVPVRIALALLGESWFWSRPPLAAALGVYGLVGSYYGGYLLGFPLAEHVTGLEVNL